MNAIFDMRSAAGMTASHGFAQASRDFARFSVSTLDALSAHICVIDRTVSILMVNQAWRDFYGEYCPEHPDYCLGFNYLEICDSTVGIDAKAADSITEGIRSVIDGDRKVFVHEYRSE